MSFFEWLGRVVMLILSGMITLSIIAAIAAIPSPGIQRFTDPRAERAQASTSREMRGPAPNPVPQGEQRVSQEEEASSGQIALNAAAGEPVDPARWLEVIAYALLALAGLGALGALLLWRLLHHSRRSADALETLSAAPPPSFAPPSPASPIGS